MTKKLSEKLDIPRNTLILICLSLILGFLIIVGLIVCVALKAIEVQGVKELMGVLGGALASPSAIMLLQRIFTQKERKTKKR